MTPFMARRRPLTAHLTIWMYDLRLLASWWWLAAPLVCALAAVMVSDSFIPPERRHAAMFYPLFESYVPLFVAGFFASLFQSEQQWRVGEVRLGLPEWRLGLTGRRLVLALVLSTCAWLPAYFIASNYVGGLPLADTVRVMWLPALTLSGLAVIGGIGGSVMASYLVPFGYWVVHYALFAMSNFAVTERGLTLFAAWAGVQFGTDWREAVATGLQAAYWSHLLLGLVALVGAAWAVSSGWAGRRWSGEEGG